MADIRVYASALELANNFSEYFLELAKSYEKENKKLHIALSGGSTPKIWFEILKDRYLNKINWKLIHFYWGDERMVSPDSEESNYGEAYRILLNSSEIPPENIHRIFGENSVDDEIERYSDYIFNKLNKNNNPPSFDLVILGMGEDGHTASIFPYEMNLFNSVRLCEASIHPLTGQKRVTLTGQVINNAKNVAFLITGENKSEKLDCIINKKEGYKLYPAAHIKPVAGNLVYFLDAAAAKLL